MKQKNVYVIILVILIFLVTVVYVFFSLQQKEILPSQEENLSPTSIREQQLHGTIKDMRVEADGIYLSLLTSLPVPTESLTPEEYETYTPEAFPREEKEWKFFIPSAHSVNQESGSYFIEGEDLTVIFKDTPSEEEYVEVLFFM